MPTEMSKAQGKECNTQRLNIRQTDTFYNYLNFDFHDGPETLGLLGREI
jgi:hypothetical protein